MNLLRKRSTRAGIVPAVLALAAASAFAIQPRNDRPQDALLWAHPDLHVRQVYEPVGRVPGVDAAPALARLGSPADSSYLDLRTGRWARLLPVTPLLPGRGVGNRLTWEALGAKEPAGERELAAAAWDAFAGWLEVNADALQMNPAEVVSPGRVTVFSPDHIEIWAPRRAAGVPVRDAALSATIRHGNLVLFGTENWGELEGVGFAELAAAQAVQVLQRNLGALPVGASWKEPELVWVPVSTTDAPSASEVGDGLGYRLAWVLRYDLGAAGERFEALVDARDGTLLAIEDTAQHVATPRKVMGGVYPVSNDGTPPDGVEQPNWPMPFTNVTAGASTYAADAGGNLPLCIDGTISTALSGPFIRMQDSCGAINLSGTGDLNFGVSGGTDCTTPGVGGAGNTHASRTGFFELNQLKQMAMSHLPTNFWLQSQLTSNMNIPQACNANWNGSAINFFRSSPPNSCANTGELAGVFDHEWGHGMDNNDAVPTIANPGEGIADIYAALRLDDSCIGRGFFTAGVCNGYGNPCDTCDGIRDIDYMARQANTPTTVTWINANCGGGGGPCGGIVHCEGAVYSEAVWDLWNRDLMAAPFNYAEDQAREVTTQLTFRGATAVSSWFTCAQGSGGCGATNGYMKYLAADDDDGNLTNGTPHMTAIHTAFNRHGIACATPAPANNGCVGAPTTAPAVSGLARDRGSKLTWAAVPSASEYRIYRTDGVFGCDFGKVLIGTTDGLEFTDSGLQNGRTYSYVVVPVGANDVCLGPASSCTQVTPVAGANLSALLASASYSTTGGDGDAFLDNCETAELTLPLANVGSLPLTNVQILAAASPSHPSTTIVTPLPVTVTPSLASCADVDALLQFIPSGLAPGDAFTLELELTATEFGADHRFATVSFDTTEGDFQLFASRQFDFEADPESWITVAGTFQRDTAGGGAGGSTAYMESSSFLDGQCDIVRSPLLRMAANSTMQFSTNMDIEQFDTQWWDRANVGVYNPATGTRTLVSPSAGRAYNASGIGGTCGTENQAGWAGRTFNTWATSDWSAGALQAATFAGIPVQLQVNYGTDPAVNGYGIRFDRVTVTNAEWQVADAQPDVCSDTMPFFGDFETGNTSQWSSAVP
ncbi:MAG: hypothetical protein F9K18_03570 [Thermoanaerobaculia bacterium]|nr:MAG: hypothetical protein F9K18_03570 [Thermoanaerobaculia bacterium]